MQKTCKNDAIDIPII